MGNFPKKYVMINRGSRRNEIKFIANTWFYKTLPKNIKEADVYYDWSYKLQSSINSQCQPTVNATTKGLCSLQDAKILLPIEYHWVIDKMLSTDQELVVAQAIITGKAAGISEVSFKNNRGTVVFIIEANSDMNLHIYAEHDTSGNKSDQSPYCLELGRISMMLLIIQCVIRYYGFTQGSLQLGLDGKESTEQTKGTFSF